MTDEVTPYSLDTEWYTVPNDLIGGWSIATVNLPMSLVERGQDQMTDKPGVLSYWIADVWSEELGKHICQLHNSHRDV